MNWRRLLPVLLALVVAGPPLAASPAYAQPVCAGDNPPDWCYQDPPTGDPTGTVTFSQDYTRLDFSGTAKDPNSNLIRIQITSNGTLVTTLAPPTGTYTFSGSIPLGFGTPTICATAINSGPGDDAVLGCFVPHTPIGKVDYWNPVGNNNTVVGWVFDPDTTAPVTMRVTDINGALIGYWTANLERSDIASAYPGAGAYHGFAVTVDSSVYPCYYLYAVNQGTGSDLYMFETCIG